MEATSAVERVAERAASIQIERIRRLIVSDSSSAVTDIRERHRLNRVLVPLAQRARLVKTGRTPGWAMSTHARGCFSANFQARRRRAVAVAPRQALGCSPCPRSRANVRACRSLVGALFGW